MGLCTAPLHIHCVVGYLKGTTMTYVRLVGCAYCEAMLEKRRLVLKTQSRLLALVGRTISICNSTQYSTPSASSHSTSVKQQYNSACKVCCKLHNALGELSKCNLGSTGHLNALHIAKLGCKHAQRVCASTGQMQHALTRAPLNR